MIEKLTAVNTRPDLIENIANTEMGYIRADHNGSCWWNTIWPKNRKLETPELIKEIDAFYEEFALSINSLDELKVLCEEKAEKTSDSTEYNMYAELEHGFYWLRLITRERDYNLYLHCMSKAEGDK